MSAVRVLEHVVRPAPLGLVFWDPATNTAIADGLVVGVAPATAPEQIRPLVANRSGVWFAASLPRLPLWRTGPWLPADARDYRLSVADPLGRFLPLQIAARLPAAGGLFDWPGWAALPTAALAPFAVGPPPLRISPQRIPLFSTPARAVPGTGAVVRADLAFTDGTPAAWAIVTAAVGGRVRGIGIADARGAVQVAFAYPERPRPALATSPPAVTDFRWSVDLAAYAAPGGLDPAQSPDLGALFAQLAHPRVPFAVRGPDTPLGAQLLGFGRPLTVRTTTPQGAATLILGPP